MHQTAAGRIWPTTPRAGFYLTGRAAVSYKESVSSSPVPSYKLGKKMTVSVQLSKGGKATHRPA